MSDQKKPADSSSTESAATEEPGKELDADQLENVAGGLSPATGQHIGKFFRPNPTGDGSQADPPSESITFVFNKIQ